MIQSYDYLPKLPYIYPTSTLHRPYIDPTSTLHRPHIDPTSTLNRPYITPTCRRKKYKCFQTIYSRSFMIELSKCQYAL
jgi:hypothetical protein